MEWLRRQKRKLVHTAHTAGYTAFYRYFFGRETAFSNRLGRAVNRWERHKGHCDIPVPADRWETDYRNGHWSFLKDVNELSRYSVVAGYIASLKPDGSVLDVGCGEGILYTRYKALGFARYLGVDISAEAITRISSEYPANARFVTADAEKFQPDGQFDVIVFNESLYYFRQPLRTCERYREALKQDGLLLVSTYAGSKRALAILRRLKSTYGLVDETRVDHMESGKSWFCSVFDPSRRRMSHTMSPRFETYPAH
jgi:2-polyprenyl-3-methyl-5-hydroxy-6-metoxy-1,4-benzoquinol methylase